MGVEPSGPTRIGCSRATSRSPTVLSIQMLDESIRRAIANAHRDEDDP
jgi:hypothetical protein